MGERPIDLTNDLLRVEQDSRVYTWFFASDQDQIGEFELLGQDAWQGSGRELRGEDWRLEVEEQDRLEQLRLEAELEEQHRSWDEDLRWAQEKQSEHLDRHHWLYLIFNKFVLFK